MLVITLLSPVKCFLLIPPTCEIIHAASKDAKYGSSLSTGTFVITFAVPFHDVFKASKLLVNPVLPFT